VTTSRTPWILSGIVVGLAGVAASYATAMVLAVRQAPIVAVAELIIRITPGDLAESAISAVGTKDKPLLVGGIVLFLVVCFGWAGLLSRHHYWPPALIFMGLAAVAAVAVLTSANPEPVALLPVVVGLFIWQACLGWVTSRLRVADHDTDVAPATGPPSASRRGFLLRIGLVGAASLAVAGAGRLWGSGRRRVEDARRLLRLDGVTQPKIPGGARIGLDGVTPWRTPDSTFYLIDTAITPPAIDPAKWQLRIHGMVDRELTFTYQELLNREFTEAWITLNCVSNEVGGDLIGNAWWSGVRIAELLEEAGVQDGADAVLQTSEDGWTCGTPLTALTDNRDALLAVAMNGAALPIEHGFPVRMVVPGLYGFVSATKWLVDLKVTRFEDFDAYWTSRGWSEQAPLKIASRIDVPSGGAVVKPGVLRVGGVAWMQHVGIEGVEVSVDGGPWATAVIAAVPTNDTWVQWSATLTVEPGDHQLSVRAIDKQGNVQTGVERAVAPDGSTGWHTVEFAAEE
jgi:DMSO/TMAO reductase YedYZ molybdopterin-dependent catalytic subunit